MPSGFLCQGILPISFFLSASPMSRKEPSPCYKPHLGHVRDNAQLIEPLLSSMLKEDCYSPLSSHTTRFASQRDTIGAPVTSLNGAATS